MNSLILLTSLLLLSAPPAGDRPSVVIVIGAEGTPEYGREFAKWADRWADAATRGGARVTQVGRGDAGSSDDAGGGDGGDDKRRLQSLLDAESKGAKQPLWLVLIGHGTHDGREAKFNLRGPDLSDRELAEWLRDCPRPVAVINCASASAPYLNQLSAEGRVVVTATRSGHENNFARFGDYLSDAVAGPASEPVTGPTTGPAADLDKDGQTSLLEAFLAASHRVAEFYKQEGRLATEHALLDDNGDGLGTPADWFRGVRATRSAKDGAAPDGARAHQWHLLPTPGERAMAPELRARRDTLEREVEALRQKKSTMAEAEYYDQLEVLLLELASVYEPPQANPSE